MKYLPIREIDDVTDALNFETEDCRVVGACDIYITKAAGGDKKLYLNIESSLESQHEAALRVSASLSPPEVELAAGALNLSRSSPFGPLSQISSRRTFAYLIATLNASHPDYDFSQFLRPSDFRREKNLKKIMDIVDTNLFSMRPKHIQISSSGGNGGRWEPMASDLPVDAPETPRGTGGGGTGNATWNPKMWKRINAEMELQNCITYCYEPEDDPYDDDEDEGLPLWSFHYFFFNKAKKRVCYLYMRAFSLADDSAYSVASGRTPRTPVAPVRTIDLSWARGEPSSTKRVPFWLGDRAVGEVIGLDDDDDDDNSNANDTEVANDTGTESDVRILNDNDLSKFDLSASTSSESPSPEFGRKHGTRLQVASSQGKGPVTRSRSRGLDDDIAEAIEL